MYFLRPFLFGISLFVGIAAWGQTWDPDAGYIPPFTTSASIAASSTTNGSPASNVLDGDYGTFWQSGGTLPRGYINRWELNALYGATTGFAGSSTVNWADLTDANLNTGVQFAVAGSHAWVSSPQGFSYCYSISIKAQVANDSIEAFVIRNVGDTVKVGSFYSSDNYGFKRFDVQDSLGGIYLRSTSNFQLWEMSWLANEPYEYVVVDLGQSHPVGQVVSRHYAGTDALRSELYLSNDSITWNLVAHLNPLAQGAVTTVLPSPMNARYLQLRHYLEQVDYAKAEVWELKAYDAAGSFGPVPPPSPHSQSMAELLGVNGIWGWGHQAYSNSLAPGEGPTLYNRVSRHARNYHNLSWDTSDPDDTPDYANMPGSLAQSWLDWDREYNAWDTAGLQVEVSLQFGNTSFPPAVWDTPWQSAFNYGAAFANHFGPTNGNGLVQAFEIGNEPWDYDAAFYRTVLQGFAEGAKGADPGLQVLTGALQANDPFAEGGTYKNYIGVRLTDSLAPFIDALNVHHYSYAQDTAGIRRGVHPEHPSSSFRGILNDLRWRDHNMPGTPVYLTEWGWDSDGLGENCTHNECVSARAQAIYGVRGACWMARLGVNRLTWFFYANGNAGSSLYTRSGLTGSSNTNFQEKPSFTALEALLHHLGDKRFLDVVLETEQAYAYAFGNATGLPTHLVVWSPIPETDASVYPVQVPIAQVATAAWHLEGISPTGQVTSTPNWANGHLSVQASAVPTVIALDTVLAAVGEAGRPAVVLAPNPAAGSVRVHAWLPAAGDWTVELWTVTGQQLRSQRQSGGAEWNQVELSLQGLPAGLYQVRVGHVKGQVWRKLVVQ